MDVFIGISFQKAKQNQEGKDLKVPKDLGYFFVFLNITNEENDLYLTFFSFSYVVDGRRKMLAEVCFILEFSDD